MKKCTLTPNAFLPRLLTLLVLCFAMALPATAQLKLAPDQRTRLEEAIGLMEKGSVAEAIGILEEEGKKYPAMEIYPYEIGYAHILKKDYKAALPFFRTAAAKPDATAQSYAMIGNTLDHLERSDEALKAYAEGLKRFPKAGNLFLESGVVYARQREWNKALNWYERGIAADPSYPSNYYKAADIYLHSTEKVWGMIYGEVAMNLERNSDRTREMSELLWRAYRRSIYKTSDSSMSVSFTQNNTISAEDAASGKLPFGLLVFEPAIAAASATAMGADSVGTEEMSALRSAFLKIYYDGKREKEYPNALFDYQQRMESAGHLEAYNHWILLAGDEDAFDKWRAGHEDKWTRFVAWFKENPLKMSTANAFGKYR